MNGRLQQPVSRRSLAVMAAFLVVGVVLLPEAKEQAFDPGQPVHLPTHPIPDPPWAAEGGKAVSLASARLLAHVLVYDTRPLYIQEFEVLWPRDKGREFSATFGRYAYGFQIESVEACYSAPADPFVEVGRLPYLHVFGTCRFGGRGGGATGVIDYYNGQYRGLGSGWLNGTSMLVLVTPVAPDDPLREAPVAELLRSRWEALRWSAVFTGVPNRNQKPMQERLRPWREAARADVAPPPTQEEMEALQRRKLEEIGVRWGGSITVEEDCWVDLDTSRTLPQASAPEWPQGSDLKWSATPNQGESPWTLRPRSPVWMMAIDEDDLYAALRKVPSRIAALDSPPPPLTGRWPYRLVRTTDNRYAVLYNSGSVTNKPLFGKRRSREFYAWYWVLPSPATPEGHANRMDEALPERFPVLRATLTEGSGPDRLGKAYGFPWEKPADGLGGLSTVGDCEKNPVCVERNVQRIYRLRTIPGAKFLRAVEPLLTPKTGKAAADPRTNKVIVTDVPEVQVKVDQLYQVLDVERTAPTY